MHPVEPPQVERHTHQRARHRHQAAAVPEAGRDGGRVHQVVAEPDLAGQLDRLGPPVEHRLGADVDDDATDLGGAQAAADPRRAPPARRPRRRAAPARSRCAAASPETPPPTTTTRGVCRLVGHPESVAQGSTGTDPVVVARHSHMTKRSRAALATPLLIVLVAAGRLPSLGSRRRRLERRGESPANPAPATAPTRPAAATSALRRARAGDAATGVTPAAAATAPLTRAVISTGQVTVHTEVDRRRPGPR